MFVFIIIIAFFAHKSVVNGVGYNKFFWGGGEWVPGALLHRAGRILVSLPGIEQAKAVKRLSPNLWTTQGTPIIFSFLQ